MRCRMHGGADGSGAPLGNKNALKHGRFTKYAIEQRKEMRKAVTLAKAFYKMLPVPRKGND